MARTIPIGARSEVEETVEFKHILTANHDDYRRFIPHLGCSGQWKFGAFQALEPYCRAEEITVGTAIHVEHRPAGAIGARIQSGGSARILRW